MWSMTRYRATALVLALACPSGLALAELAAPNAAGVAMGHVHFNVQDVEANKRFWLALGGTEVALGQNVVIRFPDVLVLLRQAEASGSSAESVVDHFAFRVQSLAAIDAAGIEVELNEQYPGVASVYTPDGVRIELFDESATNLSFMVDGGAGDAVTERHNRKIDVPIVASGGVGNLQHLADGVLQGHADAVLAASIFHYGEYTVRQAKEHMARLGIEVRT